MAKTKLRQAVFAFVPVLHKGYLDFFRANEGDIKIFGRDLINQYVHLTRDLRTIDPDDTLKTLKTLFPERVVSIVDLNAFKTWNYDSTIMPEDEISEDVYAKYIKKGEVKYSPIFLRWNKIITFKEYEVPPGRKITKAELHKKILKSAEREAQKSSDWWRQIASVAVKNGKILLKTHNRHLPTDFHLSVNGDPRSNFDAGQHQNIFTSIHSEAALIAEAAKKGINLSGSDLYVTTFPCPNCARLLGLSGVKRVYYSKGYSLLDAEKILEHFGIEIVLVE
jgi:dCMP deaminase